MQRAGRPLLRLGVAVAALVLLSGCGLVQAPRTPTALPKVGVLCILCPPTFDGPAPPGPFVAAFLEGLRTLGHVDGETVTIIWRGAGGQNERLAALAEELVAERVEVIVSAGASPAAAAARRATASIPIVFLGVGDPVSSGFVASNARPGGNMTGLSNYSRETAAKRLEALKAVAPSISQVGGLYDFSNPAASPEWQDAQVAADQLGLRLQALDVRTFADVEATFQGLAGAPPDALLVSGDPFLFANQKRLLELVASLRRPAAYNRRELVADGGLISYGFNLPEHYRRAAYYVDRILKGTSPADLPVELPTAFDFAVNRKTAQALGLTIPESILHQATEVIE
jgi:putative tryptophan/tyrosine transport system substrate-binding protein